MNRRKLATSRRSKGKQRVNDPETQPDVESKEGVQDEARGNEHPETHASATKQPKVQEEVAQESERDMTAPQAAFLVSATTAEYSEDKTDMLCPEEVKHILDSKDVSMQPFKDETKLEVIESSNTLQSEEVNENLHDRLPELTSSSASASDQQMISKQAENFNLCSVAELNSRKLDDSGLFRQDGRLQGNFSVCESRVNTSITPQIIADNAFRENIQINDGVEQETFLFQTEELPTSKDDKHCTTKVRDAKLSQEVEDNQYDQNKLTQEQVEHEKHNSTEDVMYEHRHHSVYFENQTFESDSYQSLFPVKSTVVKQDVLTATKEASLDQMDQSGSLVEDNIQTPQSVFKATTETQLHNSLTTDDHTKVGFSTGATKRKFGSSRKNKGRHVKDSEEDILENSLNNESLETPTVLSEIQKTGNEEVSDVTTADTILSPSNTGSVCLVPPHDLSSEYPEQDKYSLILTSESFQKGQEKINSEISAEMFENSEGSQHEVDQSDILHSEDPIDSLSEHVPTNLQKVEFHPTQMQEILQIQHSSETIPDYVTEHFEHISENLNDRPEMSESAGKSTDNVTTLQQEHQTESYDLYDANSLQISNLEKSNSTPTQVYKFKKGVEDDIKLTADQMYHQEKGLFEIKEENPVLFDSQSQETSGIVDEQSTKGFYSSANSGKLVSGRKSKKDKDSKEEVKEKTSDEETTRILDTKITSQEELRLDILPESSDSPILSIFAPGHSLADPESLIPGSVENVETDINMDLSDKSWGENLERQSDTHKSKSGSLQTKEVPDPDVDMRKGQEHMALQEPEPQQIDYTVAGQVETVGVFVEDTKHNPASPLLQDNSLSTNEQTDTGFSGSRSKLGSSQREKGRQQGEIPKQEVLESTRDDEIHKRPTMLMQEELTEDSEPRTTTAVSNNASFPNWLVDQIKVTSNIHSELTVKSTKDSATKHKLMLIEDQQNTCFIAEGNVEALDQTSKDGHLDDSKKTSISSPVGIKANLGQMDKGGSLIEGMEHNSTDTTLQDTSIITDEQIDADFSFKGNKRKLGSSRRKKGRQDVKESKQDVLENNGGEKAIDTSPVLLKVKTSEQEEPSKASEEEIFWTHSISTSHVLSSEDQTSEVTEGPGTHLKGSIMKCENHQEDVDERNFNVLVQDGKQSEDLSLSQYKAHTEDTRDACLEDVMVEHPEEVDSITMQDSLQMGYYSETSTNINKTFDIMSENLTEKNERSQLTVKGNDDITEKQEECPTEEIISETLDLKSGAIEQDDTKPKVDQIFHKEKEGMFCEMEENKPVLSNFQIETVSLDPKPQESSESTEDQINTDFSSSASRRKLGSSRKGKARRQVNEFKDEVNEKTRVDEVDETHRTTQISLDTKTISHEEKRQDTEQDATLLVSNNSFSVFACGDSSEVQISSKIHSELTLKHTADSGTEQELLPAEDQQNLCSTTERNLEALNQTSKDDHLYDSKETSISGPIGVNTTLGYMDEGGTLEKGSEHNSIVQDSSVSTNEQTNDDFSFNGSRRKLGSSHRNKGRPGFKESKQQVFENHRSDETPQTPTTSVETRGSELEELSEDIEHKIILSLSQDLSSVSPHIISSENQISVSKNDSDTNLQILILKNEHFGDKGERKLEADVEMIEKSMNVLHQEVGQSDTVTVHSEDTRDAEPEDALSEVEKFEFHPTQMQDSIHTECYSETVVGNVSENEEVILENLTDQTGMSELTVKATDDSATKEEAYSVKKNYPENLDLKNEDSGVFDNNKSQVTDLEKANSVPTEMNEFEGRVSDDTKPNTGFVVDLEMGGLCEMTENSSAWLNAQTDMVSFDSRSHEFSQNVDEQLNKGFYNTSNRQKLGSSRRIKGRHQVEEGKENTSGDETLNISETKLACEELKQDLSSPDSSVLGPGNSSDVQSAMLNNYSETDLKSLIQESHSEDKDESETGNVKLSHKSEGDTLLDKSDVQESNDQTLQSKVTGPGCSDNAETQTKEHENLPADIEVCLQKDYTSETVAHDIPTYLESDLGNTIDQAEIINHSQSDLTTKSYIYSNTKEELLPAEGQQNLCFTTQGSLEVLDQKSKDEHNFDSKETSTSNPVGVNSAPSQMGEGGILVESTMQNPRETNQDNSLTTDGQTDAGLHGSRRKLGYSRRKKGRRQGKESQEEDLENTSRDKTFEMPIMSLETKTVEQEEQREETKHEIILSVSHDSSMSLIPPVISSHDQSTSVPTHYPDEVVQSLTLKNENLHEDADDKKSDVLTSDEAKQNVFHGDPRNAVSENVVHEKVHSAQIQDSVKTDSDHFFADDATENVDIISRALTDKTEEPEINMNRIDDIASIQEACPSKEVISAAPGLKNEEEIQQDAQPNTDHIVNQNNEGLFLQMEETKFAMSNLQSGNVSSGSHPLESSERVEEQTKVDFHSRRKLGSSRRNKGRGNAKDIGQPITEVDLNASMNELGEKRTETVAQDQETLMGIVLDETEENDSSQTKDANISSSFCTTVGMQPSPIVDQEDSDTSFCTQIIDRELPKHHSRDHDKYRELQDGNLQNSTSLPEPHAGPPPAELRAEKNSSCEHTDPESGDEDASKKAFEQETEPEQNQKMLEAAEKERDDIAEYPEAFSTNLFSGNEKNAMNEITEILQPDKNVQSEQFSEPPERTTERGSNMQNAQVKYCIEQSAASSPQEMFHTDGEEHQHIILSKTAETHYLLDFQSKEQKEQIKTEQMHEMHQISFPNHKSLRETVQSDKHVTLDSHPQDNHQDLKDDAHPGFKASGNRRKLGSSRRTKGSKHGQVNDQNQENTGDNETKILAGKQEELENVILPKNLATISSSVTEKLLEENPVSSHDVLEESTIEKSDFNSNSNQENSIKSNVETKEKDAKRIDEAKDSTQLTGHDTNKTGLMQSGQDSMLSSDSGMHSILLHDGVISLKSESVYVTDEEEALQRQKREALSCEKDQLGAEVHLKETNKEIETAGFITTEVCSSQAESATDLQNPEKGEVEGTYIYARKQKNTSNEFVSALQEPAMDASYKGEIPTTINPLESQGEKPQETSKQKKRKIGSSRRTPLNRKRDGEKHERDEAEESDSSAKAVTTNLSKMEVVGKVLVNEEALQDKDVQPQQEASLQQETPKTETGDGLQSSNMSQAFPPEQSATRDLILETPKPDDFTNSQAQTCSEDTERNSSPLNQPVSSNTGTPGGSLECTQGDERSPESIEVSQLLDVQEQMPSNTTESIHSQNPEMRNGSPDLTPTNRRRKMGSTRKNLGTRTKQEIPEPEKESTDTVLSSGDVTVPSVSGKEETELQLHTDDNTYQEKQKETVEISQFGESLLRALAEEEKVEESSVSQTQTAETRRQWNPSGLSSSPSNDGTSESAFGGRKKKFGSNRKSGLQQRKPDQNAQNEDEAGGPIEGSALKAAEREESSGLGIISEVDENGQKPSSSTDILEATGSSKSMRDKTPEKLVHRNIRLDQESGNQLSFGTTSGADKSVGYNVVMIGESCVGKTSFMKRAQSGKFSLDIPASVGLDSCKWTVVVDGKPVVLQLWDTAGQERFHSITRQVFHKAQAFLLMYDITSSQSFSAVSYWANSIQEAAAEDVTVLLLGNKSEHAKRQVKTEQGDILAKEYNFEFMECSAATGENVIEALEAVARMLSQRADLLGEEVTALHKEPAQRKSSKCC